MIFFLTSQSRRAACSDCALSVRTVDCGVKRRCRSCNCVRTGPVDQAIAIGIHDAARIRADVPNAMVERRAHTVSKTAANPHTALL